MLLGGERHDDDAARVGKEKGVVMGVGGVVVAVCVYVCVVMVVVEWLFVMHEGA